MGLFNNYIKEGKGVKKSSVEAPLYISMVKRFSKRFWQLVLLNLLYTFACLPIITIGPATAGLNYVLRNYSQDKPTYLFSDFVEKCKENFKQGFIISIIDAILAAVLVFSAITWSDASFAVPTWLRPVALIFIFFVFYVFISANFYIFPMMVSFNLKTKQIIRNSIILGAYKLGQNIIMIIFSAVIIFVFFITWPASMPMIFFLPFSLCGFFINSLIYPILIKHIATPAESKSDDEKEDSIFKDNV